MLIDTRKAPFTWSVYTLGTAADAPMSPTVYYVGCCPFQDVLRLPDARRNSLFPMIDGRPNLMLQFISNHASEIEARNVQRDILHWRVFGEPRLNAAGVTLAKRDKRQQQIKHVESGIVYPSIRAAASALMLSAAMISNQLNRVPGYRDVRGNTFEKVD